jgi:GT2 family glycosyltransferase
MRPFKHVAGDPLRPRPADQSEALHSSSRVDCAVVIVTYNSAHYITGLLDSLPAAATDLALRTIVVDNGSVDATIEIARSYPEIRCVEAGANLGYAGGINVGRQVAAEYGALLVLNPDVVLEAGAIREMFTALRDPAVGMVAPIMLEPDGRCFPSLRREPTLTRAIGDCLLGARFGRRPGWLSEMVWDDRAYLRGHAIDWATGAALMMSAECDRAVGSWDERFFLYSEEVDYAARVRSAGFRVEFVPTARVRHRGGGSGQSQALSALLTVNKIMYMEKYGRWPRAYRAVVILNEMLRVGDPAHRATLRVLLRRSAWSGLSASLGARSAAPSAAD